MGTGSRDVVARARSGTGSSARSVGAGLLVLGVSTYAFFIVAGRSLTPDGFAGVSVVYTLLYTVGAGFLQPVEAHLSKTVAAAQAQGFGAGAAVSRIAAACVLVVLLSSLVLVGARTYVADAVFAGDEKLVAVSALGLLGFTATYLVRGVIAGLGRFQSYGSQMGLEGCIRAVGAVVLSVVGIDYALPYALLIAVAPPLATLLFGARRWRLAEGPGLAWRSAFGALGWLAACGVASQVLANAGPMITAFLATSDQFAAAGRLMAALVLVRIPLFLFAATQAVLVPTVAAEMAGGRRGEVRKLYRRLSVGVSALAVSNAVALALFGPGLLVLLFGPTYTLSRMDFLLLGIFAAAQVHAQLSYQTLLGLGAVRSAFSAWSAGLAALGIGILAVEGLVRRVEIGLVAGALTAAVSLACIVAVRLSEARGGGRRSTQSR